MVNDGKPLGGMIYEQVFPASAVLPEKILRERQERRDKSRLYGRGN